jgi:hypothetical protein
MAMLLYSKLYNKSFSFLGCYEKLLSSPKWNKYCRNTKKKEKPTNKQNEPNSAPCPSSLSTQLPSTNTSIISSGDETSVPLTRPIGSKHAKEDLATANTAKKNKRA